MKIQELIELLQDQARITPHADVVVDVTESLEGGYQDMVSVEFNGQEAVIYCE